MIGDERYTYSAPHDFFKYKVQVSRSACNLLEIINDAFVRDRWPINSLVSRLLSSICNDRRKFPIVAVKKLHKPQVVADCCCSTTGRIDDEGGKTAILQ